MKDTETEIGTAKTYVKSPETQSQRSTAGASERRAKISASQDLEPGYQGAEVPSFEKYFASQGKCGKKIDPSGSSMKMLRECYQATEDLTSLLFSLKWMNSGTIANGFCSTANITEYPKTESACILSDILDLEVDKKYFLSKEQMSRIVFQ